MEGFSFQLATRVLFGNGVVDQIGQEAKKLGSAAAVVVTDANLIHTPGFSVMLDSLTAAGLRAGVFPEVEADPTEETIARGVRFLRDKEADLVIAFGGGSPMDAAKAISLMHTNSGAIDDYLRGRQVFSKPGLTLICIPTTAGTGSEVTLNAVIRDPRTREKIGVGHPYIAPTLALVDPELHVSMPPAVTAATGMDALTHAIEAYLAARAHPITDAVCLHAIRLIGGHLRRAVGCGRDLDARGNMALASLLAGIGFTNAGLGAVHGIAHPVGARYGVAHGVANGIVLPYVMEYCLMANRERFRQIAAAIGEDVSGLSLKEAAVRSVEAVKELKQDVGLPAALKDVGVAEAELEAIVESAAGYRLLPNSPRELNAADLRIIVRRAIG